MIRVASAATLDPDWPMPDGPVETGIIRPKPLSFQPLPRWTRIQGEADVNAPEAAAFAAGAALFALDQIIRADPPWLGAWRHRQALAAAAVSARLLRLREDEAALRDAHHLTRRKTRGGPGDAHRPGDDPGPAGRLYRTWRGLAARPTRLDPDHVGRLARELDMTLAPEVFEKLRDGQGAPIAVAADMAAGVAATAAPKSVDGEILALMAADLALAQKLGWPVPLPLLATAILHPALKAGTERRRARPNDPDWAVTCQGAYALAAEKAHARALELARRSEQLFAAAGKVRTRGSATGIDALLADDAVTATALEGLGSERAARRFLERLATLGAIRELTGRPSFRLYGL